MPPSSIGFSQVVTSIGSGLSSFGSISMSILRFKNGKAQYEEAKITSDKNKISFVFPNKEQINISSTNVDNKCYQGLRLVNEIINEEELLINTKTNSNYNYKVIGD
tara:strand:- start:168 stop:485 length:318 start_codon:yes stop_codon:yes gene_type:complete